MKAASALLKEGRIFIQAYAETTSGMWIAFGPVFTCTISQKDVLASNIVAALELSTRNIPSPDRNSWKQIQKPMLDAVGVKSWGLLAKRAKAVGVEYDGHVVKMTPSSEYENDGGIDLQEKAITCAIDAHDLGENLVKAFEMSS